MIRLEGVTAAYRGRPVLDDITLEIAAGERVAIIGPNGAGKSTLLKAITGGLAPVHGTVRLAGARVSELDRMSVARWWRGRA